jgi:hypothetical protein
MQGLQQRGQGLPTNACKWRAVRRNHDPHMRPPAARVFVRVQAHAARRSMMTATAGSSSRRTIAQRFMRFLEHSSHAARWRSRTGLGADAIGKLLRCGGYFWRAFTCQIARFATA